MTLFVPMDVQPEKAMDDDPQMHRGKKIAKAASVGPKFGIKFFGPPHGWCVIYRATGRIFADKFWTENAARICADQSNKAYQF